MNTPPPATSARASGRSGETPAALRVAARSTGWRRRLPLAFAVLLIVAAGHGLFFWLIAQAHFMPKVGGYSPPPSPPNFGAIQTTGIDPTTGERTTETLFVVSTQLATPTASPTAAPASAQSR